MDFKSKFDKWIQVVNSALDDYIGMEDGPGSNIYNAMKYSLMAGGKRIRPVLALAVCDLLKGNKNDVLPYACAIEMIHTYSLIHDDLPAMDNDDYRRGIPTNHKVFGYAMAILAGDALLNKAYELMLSATLSSETHLRERVRAMSLIADCAGPEGMIRGQVVDMESEGKHISRETLEYMHQCKTGALIKAPVLAASYLCGASETEIGHLESYAVNIGLAFQIKDDIMNVMGDPEQMGKAAGSDAAAGKSTYATLLGLEEAEVLLEKAINTAVASLESFGRDADFLIELARYIKERDS